ncbi:MAG TPA: glycoside hydrolase family 9 protein [Bacteroidota bacterium]|nr:glycoside hydrolase family 9 protein [Bacteroidota bacterium]
MKPFSGLLLRLVTIMLTVATADAQYALVDQAGYLPDRAKSVYFVQADDSFYVVNTTSGAVQFRGVIRPLQTSTAKDPASGLKTYLGDFSALTAEGTYRITTTSGDTSYPFTISARAFEDVFKKSLKGYYYQRCGGTLPSQYAGLWARTTCHTDDGTFHSTADKTGHAVTTGGWHDAGDYGKYVVNAGVTLGTMLMSYELFPSKVRYDDLNIPESGNSVPDLLDEARYELNWFLTMQDAADGGVYFKVTTANFDAFEMPNMDSGTRYIYQKSSTATADFAAVMAQAARIFKPFDTTYASQCLSAARLAWQYLAAHTSIVPTGGFRNPTGTSTGEYGDNNDSDERLWAAAELFVTTGEDSYHSYFKAHYDDAGIFSTTMGWADVRSMAHAAYLFGVQAKADTAIRLELRSNLATRCASLLSIVDADGLNVSLMPAEYTWGSNSVALNNGVILVFGYLALGNNDYFNAALSQLNYILGCNRHDMTFVTGVGSASPMHPHHRPSASDGIVAPVPGLMSGGPDKYLDDPTLQADFSSSTPPAACYVDDQNSYASNEIAINWNAPLVFLSGFFNESPATGVAHPAPLSPETFRLSQNYPNPFNPSTTIAFQLAEASHVDLKVYDILGRLTRTLVDERKGAGSYSVTFDGSALPSGVYMYRLQAGTATATKKMILVK